MAEALAYWAELYRKHKRNAVALDIETAEYDGPISVVSLFRKKSVWNKELIQFTQGDDLTVRSLRKELQSASLIITFNGLNYDLPKLDEQYPNAVPKETPVLDLFLFARSIGFKGGLKPMEKVMGIKRSKQSEEAIGATHRLWKRYVDKQDEKALAQLLEYADDDVRNLFELADVLIQWADAKLAMEQATLNRIENFSTSPLCKLI